MKTCPNCQKEFPDSMRFCQTDGTPLVEFVEEVQAEDPLKTTVVRTDDFASSIPDVDPFKTMVGTSIENKEEDEEDVLQLPEEHDPLKTMIAPPSFVKDKPILEDLEDDSPKFDEIKEEIQSETPSSYTPMSDYSSSLEPPMGDPEPPKFKEPDISPPDFSDYSSKEDKQDDLPATMIQSSFDAGNFSSSEPKDNYGDSPFSKPQESFDTPSYKDADPLAETEIKPTNEPFSSPFDSPSSPFDSPASPFGQSSSPFEEPKSSFEPPKTQFQEPEKPFDAGIKFGQTNEPPFGNQPLQQAEWNPPPAPDSNWQNQGIGQNTPFQPPPAMQGQNQTLPIISLVLGIVSICCYIGWATGPAALITGYFGMKNVNNDPNQYGGKGLAIAGMIVGGIFGAIWLVIVLIYLLIWLGLVSSALLGGFA